MDFSLSDEQEAIRDAARGIFASRSASRHDRVDGRGAVDGFDSDLWHDLAAANLLGIGVPERAGGSGGGLTEIAILLVEAGRALVRVPLLPTLLLGVLPLVRCGNGAHDDLLARVVSGSAVLTAALVEPDINAPFEVSTTAAATSSGWELSGHKTAVPYASVAERVLVPARTDTGVRLFLIDPRAGGVKLTTEHTTDGSPQSYMELTGVLVDEADSSAVDDDWFLLAAATGYSAYHLGIAEESLRMTAEYTSARHQFGRPIGSFQAVASQAANAYIDVMAMRVTLLQAAWLLSEERPAARAVAIAKFWSAEAGQRVSSTAQHLHGGIGVDTSYPLHRYLLASKQTELTLGGAGWHLNQLAAVLDT
jgi:alkylation response protein AidB-like acyl-CoA dehydrogenase